MGLHHLFTNILQYSFASLAVGQHGCPSSIGLGWKDWAKNDLYQTTTNHNRIWTICIISSSVLCPWWNHLPNFINVVLVMDYCIHTYDGPLSWCWHSSPNPEEFNGLCIASLTEDMRITAEVLAFRLQLTWLNRHIPHVSGKLLK